MENLVKFSTDSVISFLEDNTDLVGAYLGDSDRSDGSISYSRFLWDLNLSGTTKEGVDLLSSLVCRSVVSDWLRNKYANIRFGG